MDFARNGEKIREWKDEREEEEQVTKSFQIQSMLMYNYTL